MTRMSKHTPLAESQPDLIADKSRAAGGFRLMHYFTLTSAVAFTVVSVALYVLQQMEGTFFETVQREQGSFFAQVQTEFMRSQKSTAREDLLLLHQASHVNLTHVLSNVLWDADFAPFIARVSQIPINSCQAIGLPPASTVPNARLACFAEVGRQIMALPGFAELDAKVHATMRKSSVFKIKVFDLRGITVYSSEHRQIGEDKADNRGWQSAIGGQAASELTHRDRFSAFEGMVENRDMISSYIPKMGGSADVIGVFEIYSDVTPILKQIDSASIKIADLTTENLARVAQAASKNQRQVDTSSDQFLLIMGTLLALLYVALLMLVRNGQRIIDGQARAQELAILREERWFKEKMAALATMAANVAHEVGNPLATISALAEQIAFQQESSGCSACQPKLILEQTQRIASMTRQIADFAAVRNASPELVDVNQMVKAVCDFLCFDHHFSTIHIEFRPDDRLPARLLIPDHLNEALMNLLQACAEGKTAHHALPQRILVETLAREQDVVIRIGCESAAVDGVLVLADAFPDSRFESARRRVLSMGGQLSLTRSTIEMSLPVPPPEIMAGCSWLAALAAQNQENT
jgi:signal transduction histidine kinase